MSRRTVAGLLAAGLLLALVVQAARMPVPYVTVTPGPTIDVLGRLDDRPIVEVRGHRTYPTDGELRLTTVSVTSRDKQVSLVEALVAWVRDSDDVIPFEAMYSEANTAEEERAESAAQMVNSQDTAVAAALDELGYRLPTYAEITAVSPTGPSEGQLRPRDRILAIDGTPVREVRDVFEALEDVAPGDTVRLRVRRDGQPRTVAVRTVPSRDDPGRPLLGIYLGTGYRFPFDVQVRIDDSIGGPSAGLMFALAVYDALTRGSLTGGRVIAGTGTISADGAVGPIGGIRQKIAAAERSGAELFLVPPDNCAEAVRAPVEDIELVRAESFDAALTALRDYVDNPDAELPRCAA